MDFRLSGDQLQFDAVLRRLLADTAAPAQVLAAADRDGFDPGLWAHLVEIGASLLTVPEGAGGLGGNCLDAAVLAEALGASAAPVPSLGSLALAPFLVAGIVSPEQRDRLLPAIADGSARMALAMAEGGSRGFESLSRAGDNLTGQLRVLPEAVAATHLIVVTPDRSCLLIATGDARIDPLPSLDRTRPIANVGFAKAAAEDLGTLTPKLAASLVARARVLLAAETVGAAQAMLDGAVAYAGVRRQFGRPIGSFQAIKHLCAEMVTKLEPCRALVWYAAHAIDEGFDDACALAAHAKAHIGEVGRDIASTATQVHGAMGFTHEFGLHLLFKRIAANRQIFGAPEQCREEIIRSTG